MTNDEQRIAIGEACGYVWYRIPKDRLTERRYRFLALPVIQEYEGQSEIWKERADGTERPSNMEFMEKNGYLPRYLSDLNAMHEAERMLAEPEGRWADYGRELAAIIWTRRTPPLTTDYLVGLVAHATAAERAEAFLRTLGRWKEDGAPLRSNSD